jgi:hypothetical protein
MEVFETARRDFSGSSYNDADGFSAMTSAKRAATIAAGTVKIVLRTQTFGASGGQFGGSSQSLYVFYRVKSAG